MVASFPVQAEDREVSTHWVIQGQSRLSSGSVWGDSPDRAHSIDHEGPSVSYHSRCILSEQSDAVPPTSRAVARSASTISRS